MKKLKYILIFNLTFLIFNSFCFAQKIDSLLTLLKTDAADSNKVKHLNKLCFENYLIGSYDKGLPYGKQALELAQSLAYKRGEADAYHVMALIYDNQGNFPEALKNNFAALKI